MASSVACGAGGDVSGGGSATPPALSATPPALIEDGAWDLRVDRVWDSRSKNVSSPSDALADSDLLADSDFRPVSGGPTYRVVVSEHGSRVAIDESSVLKHPLEGERAYATADQLVFDLSEGTFAGGRFVVWPAEDGLQGELTFYGSGVPIVKSERGVLVPVP